MDCPNCGKDLQPFPFDMILPDTVLQTLVDKLFPEAVEADYQEEMQFYLKRRLPLPERLASRGNRLNRSIEDLDTSFTAMSEADSELMSESHSLDVSLIAPELMATSDVHHKNEAPVEHGPNADPSSSENVPHELDLLDKQIDALVSVPVAEQAAPQVKTEVSETSAPAAAPIEPQVESAPESDANKPTEHQSEPSTTVESAAAPSEAMDVTPVEVPSEAPSAPADAPTSENAMNVALTEDTTPAETLVATEAQAETKVEEKLEAPAPSESSMDVDPSTS